MIEIWKPIFGGKYEVSNIGRLRTVWCRNRWGLYKPKKERILFQLKNKDGYMQASLYTEDGELKSFKVHRLVALAFIENLENKPQVNHLNSIRHDNRVENLEWCTISENQIHSVRFGKYKAKNFSAKITESDAKKIYNSTKSIWQLSKIYKLHPDSISNIKMGKTWSTVTGVLPVTRTVLDRSGQNHYLTKFKDSDVIDIYNSNESISFLSKKYGVGKSTICAIKSGQNWAHLTNHKQQKLATL